MTVVVIADLSYADSKSVVNTVLVAAAFSLPTAVLGMLAGRVAARVSHRWVTAARQRRRWHTPRPDATPGARPE